MMTRFLPLIRQWGNGIHGWFWMDEFLFRIAVAEDEGEQPAAACHRLVEITCHIILKLAPGWLRAGAAMLTGASS